MDTRDEFTHPVGDHSAWSESYYFNFVDSDQEVGMFARMGFRANEGTVDGLCGIYLGGHRVAFIYSRERIGELSDDLRAGGLSLERVQPFRRWGIRYSGPAQDIGDDRVLVTRRKERPEGWFSPAEASMDLVFEGLNDPYYSPGGGEHGHFEQVGHVRGTLAVGGRSWTVDGHGVRDKSWGPRTWQGAGSDLEEPQADENQSEGPRPFMHWFSMNFGPDYAVGASCGRRNGEMRGSGWTWRDGKNLILGDITVTSEFEPGSILHNSLAFTGTDEEGVQHDIDGSLITVTATKIAMPGGATFVNEGLARFNAGGRTGFGIAEYWHAVSVGD
ncbi:MAG TPA: hypothetical protein QGF35_05585 [Dehalococcoidia bacterium]|nr:hypothetical protein [Dehalococcoidia bacterium]